MGRTGAKIDFTLESIFNDSLAPSINGVADKINLSSCPGILSADYR